MHTAARDVIRAQTIIIATGMKQRKLGIKGEDTFQRRGVFYSAVQDLSLLSGKRVTVIGGGKSAVGTSLN